MPNSLSTRIALLVAGIVFVALVTFSLILNRSTSQEFVEVQHDIASRLTQDGPLPNALMDSIEDAFSRQGWEGVQKFVRDVLPTRDPTREAHSFVALDENLSVQAVRSTNLENVHIEPLANDIFRVSVEKAEYGHVSSMELETSAWRLTTDAGVMFGWLIIFPEPVDAAVGDAFAVRVWRAAAIGLIATIAVAMLATFFALQRALKPVGRLTEAANRLNAGTIPEPIELTGDWEFRNLIQAFNSATQSIAETDNVRKQLISDIAHELRTPLTNIKGQLEAMEAGLVSDPSEWQTVLRKETGLLERLVNDFQQLALSDSGQLEISRQPLPLAMLAADVLKPQLDSVNANLEVQIPESIQIFADEDRMRQVFGNLIENSIRHRPTGLTISVTAEQNAADVAIRFTDNGPGIDEKDRPLIFDRFYRAEQSRNRATGGSGLGLSIAKALVEAMGGSLTLVVDASTGATFQITLPAAEPV